MSRKIPITPCKDCTERSAECHASCERYLDWRKTYYEIVQKDNRSYYGERAADTVLKTRRERFPSYGKMKEG